MDIRLRSPHSFTIRLEDYETKLADRTLYLVVRYNPGSGGEYWDNNDGANYRVGFKRVAASPLPSPAISGAHSQQRTFSAPMTMKTTPTTGAISAPYAPPTRQLAPAPPQLTRSLSSPFPPVNPTFAEREQDQRELVTRRSLASPTAAYLSKKLSLSNYVAPTASSSMVTPPASPPDTIRIRSSSLPTEAGHNADDSKEQSHNAKGGKDATPSRPALISRITMVQGHPATTLDPSTDLSSSWNRPPSPSAGSPPALSPLSIPGPSSSALANQARSFGSMSYGFGFDGGSTLGYSRPQLLSPPRSKESSPASSGKSSPRREGSPERLGKSALGLEVFTDSPPSGSASGTGSVRVEPVSDDSSSSSSDSGSDDDGADLPVADPQASRSHTRSRSPSPPSYASSSSPFSPSSSSSPGSSAGSGAGSVSVASLTNAVRELGLNIPPHAAANANARVDTSDPSYAALLKQWCFVQSSPDPAGAGATPAATATAAVTPPTPVPAVVGSGETTPTPGSVGKALGFGQHAGYGFPGFSFGLPDAGMVGGEFLVCCLRRAWRCRGAARCRRRCFRCMR